MGLGADLWSVNMSNREFAILCRIIVRAVLLSFSNLTLTCEDTSEGSVVGAFGSEVFDACAFELEVASRSVVCEAALLSFRGSGNHCDFERCMISVDHIINILSLKEHDNFSGSSSIVQFASGRFNHSDIRG